MSEGRKVKHQIFMDKELEQIVRERIATSERSMSSELRYLVRLGLKADAANSNGDSE